MFLCSFFPEGSSKWKSAYVCKQIAHRAMLSSKSLISDVGIDGFFFQTLALKDADWRPAHQLGPDFVA